mmetsp:Transcript_16572/g.28055  ORF Transcript_16572/g.28055 Transcript_16572/m.28055 type:complete len:522 (+) Transcript_16572:23-1588(+)
MSAVSFFLLMLFTSLGRIGAFAPRFGVNYLRLASEQSRLPQVPYHSRLSLCTDTACSVTLLKGKARLFQNGNPIIYGGAIQNVYGNPAPGEEVVIKDHHGNTFGRGFFNPYSQYRVRMTATTNDKLFDISLEDLIYARIEQAIALRKALSLPNVDTNVYRLVNGEGDRLGGLIIDVLGDTIVIQSSALWVEIHKHIIKSAVESLLVQSAPTGSMQLLWRRAEGRLKQDGYDADNPDMMKVIAQRNQEEELENENESGRQQESRGEKSEVVENGIIYTLCAASDQKTGFYCDQRENRQWVRELCEGKTVLDTYCYSGGFSLNAVLGGAASVLAVDSSARALETLERNIHRNQQQQQQQTASDMVHGVNETGDVNSNSGDSNSTNDPVKFEDRIALQQGDAVAVMKQFAAEGRTFDIVICDPPKLAPTRKSLDRAMNKYQKINSLAMSLVNNTSPKGGLLLTCTCSAAMSQSPGKFQEMLANAARIAQRDVTIVGTSGAAGDHPVLLSYPEGRYLTAVLLHVR